MHANQQFHTETWSQGIDANRSVWALGPYLYQHCIAIEPYLCQVALQLHLGFDQ